ncbi:MAG: hypothetical protein M3Q08_13080 [Pseudomonadota bacterium]|nr:hypothetical protein [Pseudomonadota bacterium]
MIFKLLIAAAPIGMFAAMLWAIRQKRLIVGGALVMLVGAVPGLTYWWLPVAAEPDVGLALLVTFVGAIIIGGGLALAGVVLLVVRFGLGGR